jgi:hypothetical protein
VGVVVAPPPEPLPAAKAALVPSVKPKAKRDAVMIFILSLQL